MYNNEISTILQAEFGLPDTIKFAEMSARVNQLLAVEETLMRKEEKEEGYINEKPYEAMWWRDEAKRLKSINI